LSNQVFGKRSFGDVNGGYFVSRTRQPSFGRGEAEGLMAQFIRRDENNTQCFYFFFGCLAMIRSLILS